MAFLKSVDVYGKNSHGEDTENHFVVKTAPGNRIFRKAFATRSIYMREIFTYENILPTFFELQKRYKVPQVFDSYPEYYSSSTTDAKEFLVMKNVFPLGYRNHNKFKTIDFNHALLVIKRLGQFHALSFALRKKNFEAFCGLRNNAYDIEYQPGYEPTSQPMMDLYGSFGLESLDPEKDKVVYEKFNLFRKNIVNVTKDAVREMFDSEHAVIVHGDFWTANILFNYQDRRIPADVLFLDWQFTRIGSPAFDISQLLFICCDKETRDKHYEDLINAYYKSLSEFLKFFDEDANELFPYEMFLRHLKEYSVMGLAFALRVIYLLTIEDDDGPSETDNPTDLQELITRPFRAKRYVNVYKTIMKNVITDYVNFGYRTYNMTECVNNCIRNILSKFNVHDYVETASEVFKGNNFMGTVRSVDVRGKNADGDDVDMSFVVKNAPANELFRKINAIKRIYEREIYTYENVLPSFVQLQEEYEVKPFFHSFPEYHASSHADTKEFLILKNMTPLGYEIHANLKSVDFNHALLIIKELGRFHALSFALKRKYPKVFREICANTPDIEYLPEFVSTSDHVMELFCAFALNVLDPVKEKAIFEKFDKFCKKIGKVAREVVREGCCTDHAVVTHGNLRVANLLFKYKDGKIPSDLCMVDFQLLRMGSPVLDISQLLFLCCDKQIRKGHYTELISAYHQSLSSFLKKFGEDADELFSYDVLQEHLKKYSVYGFATALRTLYLISIYKEDFPDPSGVKNPQECIDKYMNAKKDIVTYTKMMREIIFDYFDLGYDV
ncbi:hypothetical protein FQR65_LT12231 [Abscondita terminalis]|nr:hypothetical protein FQR65_LT12231 [Abscondita terminalis]